MRERRLAVYQVQRDPELEGLLIEAEARFWHEHVEAGVPPEPTTLTDVRRRWPADEGGLAVASDGIAAAVRELHAIRARQQECSRRREALEMTVQAHMGDAAELADPAGRTLATWKSQTTRRLDTKALTAAHPELVSQFRAETRPRVFRLKKETA